jgi:hypothetical protein
MSEVPLYLCGKDLIPSSGSLGFPIPFQVDMLGVRYKSVDLGEGKSTGSPDSNRLRQSTFL